MAALRFLLRWFEPILSRVYGQLVSRLGSACSRHFSDVLCCIIMGIIIIPRTRFDPVRSRCQRRRRLLWALFSFHLSGARFSLVVFYLFLAVCLVFACESCEISRLHSLLRCLNAVAAGRPSADVREGKCGFGAQAADARRFV